MGNLGLMGLIGLIPLLIVLIPAVLYLNSLRKTLLLIDVKNRTIDPNYVWFMFIIGFNLYYHFKLVNSIATSLSNEFADRNIAINQKRPGETVGYINSTFLVTYVIYFYFCTFSQIKPDQNAILVWGALISWIIYWVKINNYKKLLISDNKYKLSRHDL
jgi:hypothetical protein